MHGSSIFIAGEDRLQRSDDPQYPKESRNDVEVNRRRSCDPKKTTMEIKECEVLAWATGNDDNKSVVVTERKKFSQNESILS